MKVIIALNLCFLCMAISVPTEKVHNVPTTISQYEENATTTSEATVVKDAGARRYWQNVEGSNPFEIDPGINPNDFSPYIAATSESPDEVNTSRFDLGLNMVPSAGHNEYPVMDSNVLPPQTDSGEIEDIPESLNRPVIFPSSIYNPYNLYEKEFPQINIPDLEIYKPNEINNFDDSFDDFSYNTPKLIYSTTMRPIKGLTPCENSNVLQNIINNLLGLLIGNMQNAPRYEDVNSAVDSINSQLDTNPEGLFDPQLYPTLKYYEQKTAPGGIIFSKRLKRELKTKIVFKQDIPRINEPECKEVFLKLMALSYKAYLEASKLPNCKLKNQVLPDNPYNPTKVIIPPFESNNEPKTQWSALFNNAKASPSWNYLGQQKLNTKYNMSQYDKKTDITSTIDDELINDLLNSLPSILGTNQNTDPTKHAEEVNKKVIELEKELAALLSRSSSEYSKYKNLMQNLSNLKKSIPQNSYSLPKLITKESTRTNSESSVYYEPIVPAKIDFKSKDFYATWIKPKSEKTFADSSPDKSTSKSYHSDQKLWSPNFDPYLIQKQEPQLHIFATNNGPVDNVPTSPWSPTLISAAEPTSTIPPWALRSGPSKLPILPSKNQRFLREQSDQNNLLLPYIFDQTKLKTDENNSDTERPHVRNNRSTDLRAGLLKANIIRNNILLNALQKQNLNRLLAQRLLNENNINTNNCCNQPLINNAARTLSSSKLYQLRNLLTQYGNSQNFKDTGGSLGMFAFWLTRPAKNTMNNPEITQQNVINVFLQTGNKGFDPQQKDFLVQAIKNLGILPVNNEINSKNNELLKLILIHLKQLLLNSSAGNSGNSADPNILSKLYEMVSNLAINAEKKNNIIVLLRIYVDWASQHGFGGNINDLIEQIKQSLQNEIGTNPIHYSPIPPEVIANVYDLITKIVLDPQKQQIVMDQMKLYFKWVIENNVDLSKLGNMNQLQAYLKDAIMRVLEDNEQSPQEQILNIQPAVLAYINNLIDSFSLTIEQREIVLLKIHTFITTEKAKGTDFNNPENIKILLYFVKSVLLEIINYHNQQDWEVNPTTTSTPDIMIPTEIPYDNLNSDTASPIYDSVPPVNPSTLSYINQLINSLVEDTNQREFIIVTVHKYMLQANQAGIDLNQPENLADLLKYVKHVIDNITQINSNPQPSIIIFPPNVINPAILNYLYKLVANFVPNEEQRQTVILKMHTYIKYFISKGINLNIKINLNKLIWIVVNLIKTVVNNRPENVNVETPNFNGPNLQPDSVEIIYKLEQKLIVKGLHVHDAEAEAPNSYVKYRVPYNTFTGNLKDLMLRKPSLRTNPDELSKKLESTSNITEVSPELQGLPKHEIIKLIAHNGSFVDAKIPLDDRQSLRNAADLETAVAFERTVHDLDLIINNNTEPELGSPEEINNVDESTDINNKIGDANVYGESADINKKLADVWGYDPLSFNAGNPFYHIVDDYRKHSGLVETNTIANLLSDNLNSTDVNLPFKL